MSFSIISTPQDYQPVFNPITFIVDSSNKDECSYKYVADLYVNGSLAVRLGAFTEGSNDYGVFRLDRVLQDYISYRLKPNLLGFESDSLAQVEYYLEFREEYDTNSPCTGETTVSSILATSSTYYAWNGAIQTKEFVDFDDADYIAGSETSKFLTNIPDNLPIGPDDFFNLSFLQDTSSLVTYLVIETYDYNGNNLGLYRIANNTAGPLSVVGVGPANLNGSILFTGLQPVITDSVVRYDVSLFQNSDQFSETKIFKVDYSCSQFATKRLWFWNRLGGFDAYSFKLKSLRRVDIQRNEYSKLLGSIDGSTYSYGKSDRGRTVMSVNGRENLIYNTGWLSEEIGLWLEELYTSPELYEKEDYTQITYNITGVVYRSGTADFILDGNIELPVGTVFTYSVVDGSPIGMANSGQGTVTGFSSPNNRTDVVATINAGAVITGTLTFGSGGALIPRVVKSGSWEEKLKVGNRKIMYSIELSPAHDINIQRQ